MQILDAGTDRSAEGKPGGHDILCNHCKERPAEIFQVNGEYCVECWQIITHTNTS